MLFLLSNSKNETVKSWYTINNIALYLEKSKKTIILNYIYSFNFLNTLTKKIITKNKKGYSQN